MVLTLAYYVSKLWRCTAYGQIIKPGFGTKLTSHTEIAKPSFHGWTKSVNGVLSIDQFVSLQLFDILYDNQNINEEQEQTDYDFDEDIDKVQFEFEDSYE